MILEDLSAEIGEVPVHIIGNSKDCRGLRREGGTIQRELMVDVEFPFFLVLGE